MGYTPEKMVVIPNGYNLSQFRCDLKARERLRSAWGLADDTFLIGMVSRFDPHKDHFNLINALDKLRNSGVPFVCVLVGKDIVPENATLSNCIASHQLGEYVRLLGQRSDIPDVMNALDVHVLSSSAGVPQIFEQLEHAGYKVGAISAMNAANRLKQPAYFIPDPWTQTPADSSWWSQSLGQAVSQAVNDNAQARITTKSVLQLVLGLLRFARVIHYQKYLSLVSGSRRKPWLKALVLDLMLHDVHWSMFNKKRPNFSTLFLNAGAHIQHHYFFNAEPLRKDSLNKNPAWYVSEDYDPLPYHASFAKSRARPGGPGQPVQ